MTRGSAEGRGTGIASLEALDTRYENATINSEGEAGGPEERFRYRRRDARLAVGHHSNHGETEGCEPDAVVELRLAYGFRRYDDTGPGPGAVAGANEAIDLFSAGLRVAFDDRDFKPPTRTISPPLNYQLPGRVLLFANDRYYRFRDTAFPERGGLIQVEADYTAGSRDVRYVRYIAGSRDIRYVPLRRGDPALLHPLLQQSHTRSQGQTREGACSRGRRRGPLFGADHARRRSAGCGGTRRGFFRGEGSLLLSAEYRYPVWDTWNAFLFWDEGQVFDAYDALEMDRFEYSCGAGISVRTERAFLCGVAHRPQRGRDRPGRVLPGEGVLMRGPLVALLSAWALVLPKAGGGGPGVDSGSDQVVRRR